MAVTMTDILLARERLAPYLKSTPIEPAHGLGKAVWLKLENVNPTHSFKVRGALNALLTLDAHARERGIIAASSGNHAQGIAYAAHLTGIRACVLMSRHASQRKIAGVRRWDVEVILHGESYTDAEQEALRRRDMDKLTYVSPYNNPYVVAGQGTIGLEIMDVLPDVERVVVPVGGGGLISGVATVLKSINPSIEVIGVNLLRAPTMYNLIYGTVLPDVEDSLADALPGEIEPGSITIPLVRAHVDRIVLVDEDTVAGAMRWMIAEAGWIIEGGGAVGVAALMTGEIPNDGKATAVVVSGGNVDMSVIAHIVSDMTSSAEHDA